MKRAIVLLALLGAILFLGQKINWSNYLKNFNQTPEQRSQSNTENEKKVIVNEESVIVDVVEKALPSVVTIGVNKVVSRGDLFEFDPFDFFSPFRRIPGRRERIETNIGSGFIVSSDGLVITNKHVVADTSATYQVLTSDNKKYRVERVYRDPLNDLAILKINGSGFKPLELGNSNNLKLGQLVIAIGTPLGEFPNTVTTGIISGLGRGITAGSPFEGYVERLDNVIQTDAAINPGNSGGPLLNSKGQVIGINTAISSQGQNIGFAIPVNIVKELLERFKREGMNFSRPFLGVRYQMIDRETALINEVAEGAYIVEIIPGSPAEKGGLQEDDIIVEIDGKRLRTDDNQGLARIIAEKRVGQKISVKVWRNGEIKTFEITLEETN
ncbi:MAG: trypsin-like peptidase domain-containing protein [Patescibacteria group bacterium]|nr:trypsin-like peptidase domain-containing protein [Patescibacteria group bacterium]